MSKKDPAFLFYSKDWLEGTAEMLPAEKGIYIDLLSHQHQKGDLPESTERLCRLVGVSHEEFLIHWVEISKKFTLENGRYVNKKLFGVMDERGKKGKRNKAIGTFASILRRANLEKEQYNFIRSKFVVEEFEQIESERLTERLTEWFSECLKIFETQPKTEHPKHLQREPLKPYVETVSEGTHADFSARIMLPENQLDKESIEISCKKTLTAQILKEFNANCVNLGKKHLKYTEWKGHLANWFRTYIVEVKTPTRYKTFTDD